MKQLFVYLFLLVPVLCLNAQRHVEKINQGWKHTFGDIQNAQDFSFDDSGWERLNLPHDASIAGPFVKDSMNSDRKNGFLPRREGWYRKALNIDFPLENRKVFLEFEGVYRDARVYVNGREMAHQLNGYENFLVDISKVVKSGENLIAVSYDNTYKESSRWYNGEGLYRDVWLLVTNPVHVTYHGTYVTTPFVTDELARVDIRTEILNERPDSSEVTIETSVFSPSGAVVDKVIDIVPLGAGELYFARQRTKVSRPSLWDLETPHLYLVKTVLKVGGEVTDEYETSFGIRTLEFDRDLGLLLNGRKVLVKGVNIHHDLGPLGAAAFERGFERRLEGLKRLGCNAIRLAHNPHDSYILEWCDRNGMLVFDEAFDKWHDQFFGEGSEFDEHWKASLTTFIKRDRNHPSVFLWSVGNETHQQKSARYDFGVPMLKEMRAFIHDFEPTRKVTVGLHPSRKSGAYRTENYYREGPPEMEFYMDVVSTNYREEFWPVDKARYPQLMFILSEAQVGNLGNEWFNFNHHNSVGLFYWGGTDYIGESFGWPSKGWPNGIIDWNDHWKPFSYYIQSLYSEEPMVHIAGFDEDDETSQYWNEVQLRFQPMFSHWNWGGRDSVNLYTFSNCEEVELFINGKSMGVKKIPVEYYTKDITAYSAEEYDPEHPINTGPEIHKKLQWRVPFSSGEIVAVARTSGREVARHMLVTAGDPYKISLEPERDTISADGYDLSYITVKVVDQHGILVPNATNQIRFNVSGVATIAGVGNADLLSDEPFVADERRVFQGKALLILRSDGEQGEIEVKAIGKGLKSAKVVVKAE
ncbi:glycoside hydrolase family 2 TIM barrel-domain containing protein [Marinilabilia salmonicolor]|uniref:Beta-galactosidase n=1 Tax=Marinilabilia salmonicolor TaxID=989 RepID=A0A368UUJ5_9BACT|nr:glycoside hydrolase family 2 TIM barrel-domain containing protein [Marinilabilia salmonicolor]RCW32518.1 beta-galactosidase [Marinilabilia salmonicolor]